MKNILIFPAGTEIGIETYNSLKHSKEFNLIGANTEEDYSHCLFKYPIIHLPFITDSDFKKKLLDVVEENHIDFIIPTHDEVIYRLSTYEELSGKALVPSANVARILRYKSRTYDLFCNKIRCPEIILNYNHQSPFPLFAKPNKGQGSRGATIINNYDELRAVIKKQPDSLVTEYLPGKEYTIDCFTDRYGQLLFCEGRVRNKTINGISKNTWFVSDPLFQIIAKQINTELKLRGGWFFQLKKDKEGRYCLLEIASRISGTSVYNRAKGVNLSLLTMYDRMEKDLSILRNKYEAVLHRSFINKYKTDISFDSVYVDLDDTLINKSGVNYNLISLLYQIKNEGKYIFLITKHNESHNTIVDSYLNHHAISPRLFNEIIHVGKNDRKSDSMVHKDSIFIDDSFSERHDVYFNLGIPVFDTPEALELLSN